MTMIDSKITQDPKNQKNTTHPQGPKIPTQAAKCKYLKIKSKDFNPKYRKNSYNLPVDKWTKDLTDISQRNIYK